MCRMGIKKLFFICFSIAKIASHTNPKSIALSLFVHVVLKLPPLFGFYCVRVPLSMMMEHAELKKAVLKDTRRDDTKEDFFSIIHNIELYPRTKDE